MTRHLGITFLPILFGGTLTIVPSVISLADILNIPPYHLLILGMSFGASIKQVVWSLFISQQEMPWQHAILIAAFNSVLNTLNTTLSLWSLTSAHMYSAKNTSVFQSPSILIGTVLYSIGILTELISEIQRAKFKHNPANKGKPYSGGLFSLTRNVNYAGYTLWRMGYALASAGFIWGFIIGAWFFRDFATRGVPELDKYCQNRVRKATSNCNHG